MDRKVFCEAFPEPETDQNHNMTLRRRIAGILTQRNSNSSLYTDMNEEVVKAATYMKFLLKVGTWLKNLQHTHNFWSQAIT